jgi:hypothetical protein
MGIHTASSEWVVHTASSQWQVCTVVPATVLQRVVARDPSQANKGLTVRIEYRCNCPAGYVRLPTAFDSFASCTKCPEGTYRREDMVACEACEVGTYEDGTRTGCSPW